MNKLHKTLAELREPERWGVMSPEFHFEIFGCVTNQCCVGARRSAR